jgi:subtilisin family serine protease
VDPAKPSSSPRYPISIVMSGTSMASPHVTGAVAVLLHKNVVVHNSAKGFQDVRNAIQAGTLATGGYDERSGYGRLNVALAHGKFV